MNQEEWMQSRERADLIEEFRTKAVAFAIATHRSHIESFYLSNEDLEGIALETLVKSANKWHKVREDAAAEGKDWGWGMFYTGAKQAIRWSVQHYLRDQDGYEVKLSADALQEDADAGYLRIQRVEFRPPSFTLDALVTAISRMPIADRLYLALRYFEELSLAEVGEAFGVSFRVADQRLTIARRELLVAGMNYLFRLSMREGDPPRAARTQLTDYTTAWVERTFGAAPEDYLTYVEQGYRQDFRYVEDMLRAAPRAHQRAIEDAS